MRNNQDVTLYISLNKIFKELNADMNQNKLQKSYSTLKFVNNKILLACFCMNKYPKVIGVIYNNLLLEAMFLPVTSYQPYYQTQDHVSTLDRIKSSRLPKEYPTTVVHTALSVHHHAYRRHLRHMPLGPVAAASYASPLRCSHHARWSPRTRPTPYRSLVF